jgi:3-hydroxybutyrate dehydrogenase
MKGLVAVVTGAGSGIGRAVASMMASRGALVAVADLAGSAAESTVKSIVDNGGKALPIEMDVTHENSVSTGIKVLACT